MKELAKKIAFWVRLAGWACLLPAAVMLKIAQMQDGIIYPIMLGVIIIFAAYLLATGGQDKWQDPRKLQGAMVFSLIFVALLPAIPLFVAYRDAIKLQQSK